MFALKPGVRPELLHAFLMLPGIGLLGLTKPYGHRAILDPGMRTKCRLTYRSFTMEYTRMRDRLLSGRIRGSGKNTLLLGPRQVEKSALYRSLTPLRIVDLNDGSGIP
jgi:hypothetical protein